MKLKFVVILSVFLWGQMVFSQDEKGNNSNQPASNGQMDYFSQEEMQFILGNKEKPWNYGRLSISPFYLVGIGDLQYTIPYMTGFTIIFDHGIHHAFKPIYKRKSPLLPGLRFEASYSIYGPTALSGFTIAGGLLWLFPLDGGKAGNITLSGTAGMNFMRGQIGNYYLTNDAFCASGTLGYELSFSKIFFSIEGRFTYILDSTFPLMGAGGSISVGYKFPPASSDSDEVGGK